MELLITALALQVRSGMIPQSPLQAIFVSMLFLVTFYKMRNTGTRRTQRTTADIDKSGAVNPACTNMPTQFALRPYL